MSKATTRRDLLRAAGIGAATCAAQAAQVTKSTNKTRTRHWVRKLPSSAPARTRPQSIRTHGGVNFLMISRLVDCMHKGLVFDIDVYDAGAWSAPGPLSEQSVAQDSMPMKFPDFTRHEWKSKRPTMA